MFDVIRFEWTQRLRKLGDVSALVIFFILSFSLFPFALGPDQKVLASLAPGIIWVALMFSIQIGLSTLFSEDYEDGTLEVLFLQSGTFEITLIAKLLVFWLVSALPLVVITPVAALTFSVDFETGLILTLSIFLGTIALTMIGAVASALSLGARNASLIVPLLTLPLSIPVLIFGVAAVDAVINAFPVGRILLVLLGLTLLYLPAAILGCSLILRQVLKQ